MVLLAVHWDNCYHGQGLDSSFCFCCPGDGICLVWAAMGNVMAFHNDIRQNSVVWVG